VQAFVRCDEPRFGECAESLCRREVAEDRVEVASMAVMMRGRTGQGALVDTQSLWRRFATRLDYGTVHDRVYVVGHGGLLRRTILTSKGGDQWRRNECVCESQTREVEAKADRAKKVKRA
jgi:hypothetical protein